MKLFKLASAAAICGAIVLPASAVSVEVIETQDLKINYEALETAEGVAATYDEIKQAAKEVCAPSSFTRSLSEFAMSKRCVSAAMDKAVTDVDHPSLTAYHKAQG